MELVRRAAGIYERGEKRSMMAKDLFPGGRLPSRPQTKKQILHFVTRRGRPSRDNVRPSDIDWSTVLSEASKVDPHVLPARPPDLATPPLRHPATSPLRYFATSPPTHLATARVRALAASGRTDAWTGLGTTWRPPKMGFFSHPVNTELRTRPREL